MVVCENIFRFGFSNGGKITAEKVCQFKLNGEKFKK